MVFYETLSKLMDENNVKAKNLSEQLGIGKNQFKYWKDNGNIPNGETLILLADYFNCSVDYLLGRTDNPNGSYVNGDNSFQNVVGNHSSVTITEKTGKDKLTDEFMQLFDKLTFTDKVKIINIVNDIIKNEV